MSARRRGLRGRRRKRREVGERDWTGTPTPGVDAPTGPTQSEVSDTRNRRRHGWLYGAPIHRRGPVLYSHDSYRKKTEFVKG